MNITYRKKMGLIIACAVLAIIIAVVAVVAVTGRGKGTPVSSEYITVTVDSQSCAFFKLSKEDYSVLESRPLSGSDADLVRGTDGLLPFKQAMSVYIKNLQAAGKLSQEYEDVILFSVESRNSDDLDKLSAIFKDALKDASSDAGVYSLYIKVKTDSIQKIADENGVSYAKAYLCSKIADRVKNLKTEDLIDKSVAYIVNSVIVTEPDKPGQIDDIINDANREQEQARVPQRENQNTSSENSDSSSSDATSSDNSSSSDSSGSSSSPSSDSTSSGRFVVSSDDSSGWLPGLY